MNKIRLMFLCSGQSGLSRMAKAWARCLADGRVDVHSASLEIPKQHALATQVMAEAGIDISRCKTIRINSEMLEWADVLITLSDGLIEQCPALDEHTLHFHMPVEVLMDAATAEPFSQLTAFRRCRDTLRQQVEKMLSNFIVHERFKVA